MTSRNKREGLYAGQIWGVHRRIVCGFPRKFFSGPRTDTALAKLAQQHRKGRITYQGSKDHERLRVIRVKHAKI